MSAPAFTPGPWLRETNLVYALDVEGKCNRFGASVSGGFTSYSERTHTTLDEQEANARLIAAAPALLEALEAFVAGADAGHVSVEVDNAARAAINAAKGQAFDPSRGCNILDNVHQICPRHGHSHAPTKTQPTGGHK